MELSFFSHFFFFFFYTDKTHRRALISFFVMRTVYLWAGRSGTIQMHNVTEYLHCTNTHSVNISLHLQFWVSKKSSAVRLTGSCVQLWKAFPLINAIGHPLSLDARPHRATLVAHSLTHCHLCVCVPSYLHERKNRFMWHTCAPRGSDRKRASVSALMGTRNPWQTVSPAPATALIKALMIGFQLRSNLSSHIIARR